MKIIAVTACLSGVAHTYLAAEALMAAAKKHRLDIKVETQGAIGIENELKDADVRAADVVILANDISIKNEDRFKGKPIVRVKASDCFKRGDDIIKKIIEKFS